MGLDKGYASFRKKHNCLECAYKMESHNCFKEGICLIDVYSQDICNGCPYKRNTGKCVGFCMKKVLGIVGFC